MSGTETMCVIAHGGTDNIVRVWDPREGNSSGGTMLLRGHRVRLFIFTFFRSTQRAGDDDDDDDDDDDNNNDNDCFLILPRTKHR